MQYSLENLRAIRPAISPLSEISLMMVSRMGSTIDIFSFRASSRGRNTFFRRLLRASRLVVKRREKEKRKV